MDEEIKETEENGRPRLSPEELEAEYARLHELHDREVELTRQQIAIEERLAKKKPVKIATRPNGKIGRRLHDAAEAYKKRYPDRAVRWGFDPVTDKSKSRILDHKMDGYEVVQASDLGKEMAESGIYGAPDQPVRVVDVVLLSTAASNQKEKRVDRNMKAAEAATAPERIYVESMKEKMERPGFKVVGAIKRTEETFDVRKLPNKRKEG